MPPKSPSPGGTFGTAVLSRRARGDLLHSAKMLPAGNPTLPGRESPVLGGPK